MGDCTSREESPADGQGSARAPGPLIPATEPPENLVLASSRAASASKQPLDTMAEDAHAPAAVSEESLWTIVNPNGYVFVRPQRDGNSGPVARKVPGEIFRGVEEDGDWLRLSDGSGFMRIIAKGTQLLAKEAPVPSNDLRTPLLAEGPSDALPKEHAPDKEKKVGAKRRRWPSRSTRLSCTRANATSRPHP